MKLYNIVFNGQKFKFTVVSALELLEFNQLKKELEEK